MAAGRSHPCAGCGAPALLSRPYCCACRRRQQARDAQAAKRSCVRCGQLRRLDEAGVCVVCARSCPSCGKPVRRKDRTLCTSCHRRAEREAAKAPCPRCGRPGFLRRETGWCGSCSRPRPPRKPPRACVVCGQVRRHAGLGLCSRCWQRDPLRPIRQAERLSARLATAPEWLAAFAVFLTDRHAVERACRQLSTLGRLLETSPGIGNQGLLEAARLPGRSMGTLARSLEDFLVPQALAFPLDQAARLAAGRRARRIEATPAPLRAAVAGYAEAELAAQARARRAGTRPRADRTIEANLAILRDLATYLLHQRGIDGWALVGAGDVDAFLGQRPASAGRNLSVVRQFFRWARHHRLVLTDPTARIRRKRLRAFHGITLTRAEQRGLLQRWKAEDQAHPHERLVGLLALLHAASQAELRQLRLTDVDHGAHRLRLGHRPYPVPLDPITWAALQACLAHRATLATTNQHVIVTRGTKARQTTASVAYLSHVLDDAGVPVRTLRATRLTDLLAALDPKVVAAALGMDAEGVLAYLREDVDAARLPANL